MKKILLFILIVIASVAKQSPCSAQSWSELGGLNGLGANERILSTCSDPFGKIYAAGLFTNSLGKYYVAKWNGSLWSELGGLNGLAANDEIQSICSDALGNIYAAGLFTNSSGNRYVAQYNGNTWSELGGLNGLAANNGVVTVCTDASGNIYAAGYFTNSSGNRYVAKWNGSTWSELGGLNGLAANNFINSVYSDASGNIYAAGMFTNNSGNRYVARYGMPTGINENTEQEGLGVFPNPFSTSLTLKGTTAKGEIVIYDVAGREILCSKTFTDETKIATGFISRGFYVLKYTEENKTANFKLTKF